MDAVERLSFESVAGSTLQANAHVQRYRWAREMVGGQRVLDLCCGVGYGSLMMADVATSVHGIDISEDAIRDAREHAADVDNVTFETGDAVQAAHRELRDRYDAVVCFEGIEHVQELDELIEGLVRFARAGGRVIASVPNSATFEEENEFHVTDFDYDSAMRLWDRFPAGSRHLQFVAEGMMLVDAEHLESEPPDTAGLELSEGAEQPYAHTFLFAANVPDEELTAAMASMRFTVVAFHSRMLRSLEQSNRELWQTNRRLGRQIEEIRAALADGQPPVSAIRMGRTSAASEIVKLLDERDAIKAQRDAMRAERDAHVAERDELRSLLDTHGDPRLIPQLVEERDRLGADRGQAWHRYEELRNRKIVRLALALAGLRQRRRRP